MLTDPYVFATTEAPGMTVAVRSRWDSVVGLDLTLAQISDRLAALRSLPGMKIVLFDSQRRLLARADVDPDDGARGRRPRVARHAR